MSTTIYIGGDEAHRLLYHVPFGIDSKSPTERVLDQCSSAKRSE